MTDNKVLAESIRNYLESGVDLLLTDDDYRTIIKALEQESCEDCVSRDIVHEMLENVPINPNDKWFNWLQKACLRLAELPSVQPKTEWISVSEKLPKENEVYIVSYEDSVRLLEWFNGKWFFYPSNPAREETGTIIAWMPLPEPYTESEG